MTKPRFMQDLERDGYVVIPNIIAQKSCDEFVESGWKWLEAFPNGFRRDDRSTWTAEHLPFGHDRGLYNRYSVNHEDFVWRIRTEPGILQVFEQLWGTKDLIASFDGMNVSLPVNEKTGRTDIGTTKPWPHIDQDARNVNRLELYQGIACLSPSGPNDGGLVVLRGSHKLHSSHFAAIGGFRPPPYDLGVGNNGYMFHDEDADWYRQQGCEEIKICCGAGDLIVWDSRTLHWNASPTGQQTRFATYVCYSPRGWMSEKELEGKKEVFEKRLGTTHWPHQNVIPVEKDNDEAKPTRPNGTIDPADCSRPFWEPEATPEVLRLVGVRA